MARALGIDADAFISGRRRRMVCSAVAAGHAQPGGTEAEPDRVPWMATLEELRFTFGGLFLFRSRLRCLSWDRPVDDPGCRILTRLPRLSGPNVRAVHLDLRTGGIKLSRISIFEGGICYVPIQGKRYGVDLSGSFDDYLRKFSAKSRSTLRRKARKFGTGTGGAPNWREFRLASEMPEFRRLAFAVSRKTYQHVLLRAGFDNSPQFFEQLVREAREDRVRGYILFHRQTPAAYLFCRRRADDLVVEKMGFDAAFAFHSPGLMLFYLVLQHLFAERTFRRLDFGVGEYPYKAYLATTSEDAAELYWFPCTLRNAVLVGSHAAVSTAGAALRWLFDATRLTRSAKMLVRRKLGRIAAPGPNYGPAEPGTIMPAARQ